MKDRKPGDHPDWSWTPRGWRHRTEWPTEPRPMTVTAEEVAAVLRKRHPGIELVAESADHGGGGALCVQLAEGVRHGVRWPHRITVTPAVSKVVWAPVEKPSLEWDYEEDEEYPPAGKLRMIDGVLHRQEEIVTKPGVYKPYDATAEEVADMVTDWLRKTAETGRAAAALLQEKP